MGTIFKRLLYYLFDPKDTAVSIIDELIDVLSNKRLIKKIEDIKEYVHDLLDVSILYEENADNEILITNFS